MTLRTFSREDVDRMEQNLLRLALVRRIARRFDRCCHPGKPDDSFLWLERHRRLCAA